jgi:hypothetical protein
MKEAIKLRLKSGRKDHTYEWVDFAILKEALSNDFESVMDYRNCDWLVVDNITKILFTSAKQQSYILDLINPFFLDRFNNGLPTILVFKFDIRCTTINMEDLMGTGVSNIMNSSKTYKLLLMSELKNE